MVILKVFHHFYPKNTRIKRLIARYRIIPKVIMAIIITNILIFYLLTHLEFLFLLFLLLFLKIKGFILNFRNTNAQNFNDLKIYLFF
jgi:hypothetical protein